MTYLYVSTQILPTKKEVGGRTCHAVNEDLLALLHVVVDELYCCLHVLHSRLDVVHRGKIQLLDALGEQKVFHHTTHTNQTRY